MFSNNLASVFELIPVTYSRAKGKDKDVLGMPQYLRGSGHI
jgi:hypothetical protein